MAHLCVPQNQALGICGGFVPDIQVCRTNRREDLVNATITSNVEEEERFPSLARWFAASFLTNAFIRGYVKDPYFITGKTHWLKTLFFRLMRRCLSKQISLYFPKRLHPVFILF